MRVEKIMVNGNYFSGWLCNAHVIDQAGPILTEIVLRIFEYKYD